MSCRNIHIRRCSSGWLLVYTTNTSQGPLRVMRTGRAFQSATFVGERRFEPAFRYHEVMCELACSAIEHAQYTRQSVAVRSRVISLGGGGYAVPRLIAHRTAQVEQEVVEPDTRITQAAYRWFYLGEAEQEARDKGGSLQVIATDGQRYLAQMSVQSPGTACAIILDAYIKNHLVADLVSTQACTQARTALTPQGLLIINVTSHDDGNDISEVVQTLATVRSVFAHTALLWAGDESLSLDDNYVLVASQTPLELPVSVGCDVAASMTCDL